MGERAAGSNPPFSCLSIVHSLMCHRFETFLLTLCASAAGSNPPFSCLSIVHSLMCHRFETDLLKSLTIYQQLWSFLVLCKILSHYKSLAPSKSMPQKRKKRRVYTIPCLLKTSWLKPGFSAVRQSFRIRVRHIMTWNLVKKWKCSWLLTHHYSL